MGITVSFHRTRRKTGPLLISYRSSQDQSEIVDGKFDDINIEESNPFLASTRTTVVPNSLKQFIEVETKCQGQLNFYADGEISNVTLQQDEVCFICNVYSTSTDIFTCRVCMKSFHEGCLKKLGDLSTEVAKLHANAISKSAIGWSCYKCSNLSLLLTEDEMHEIMDLFDDFDSNQDTQISLDEYVQFKEKQYTLRAKEKCPADLKALFNDEFAIIDRDNTRTIDWWEFLNHESVKMLSRRNKSELVDILSPKEIAEIKSKFKALDVDDDGRITEHEAKKVFSDWFGKMSINEDDVGRNGKKRSKSRTLSDVAAQSHAQNLTMLVMEADSDNNRYVDWEEFLQNEALYIIASRPNLPLPMLVKN